MGKTLAIGDIHTKIWIIEKVTKVINDYDKVIFCGDYADDFSASPQDTIHTWSALKDLQTKNQGKVELVTGNHDYIYVKYTPSLQSGYNPMTHVLIDAPENKNLKEWLAGLPVIIEIDGVSYSHAGIMSGPVLRILLAYGIIQALFGHVLEAVLRTNIPQIFGHTPS